jgi:hypothetical protein
MKRATGLVLHASSGRLTESVPLFWGPLLGGVNLVIDHTGCASGVPQGALECVAVGVCTAVNGVVALTGRRTHLVLHYKCIASATSYRKSLLLLLSSYRKPHGPHSPHMRLIQRVCEAHTIQPTTNDHVRFAIKYPTLLKSVRMIPEGKLVHSAEVPPVAVKLGWICAEFVVGAFGTIHLDVRAD